MASERRASGHLLLEERKSGRMWVAAIRFGAAGRSRKVLWPARAKASKRLRSGAGRSGARPTAPAPDDHLTPKQAEVRLREMLDGLPRQQSSSESHNYRRTLGEAVDEWLRHREVEKRLKPTTMRYYRHLANHYVLPELGRGRSRAPVTVENIEALRAKGRTLALHRITIDDVDRMRRHLLERDLAPRTVAKAVVATFGVFERARRLRWIAANPAADAERVTFKTSRNIACSTRRPSWRSPRPARSRGTPRRSASPRSCRRARCRSRGSSGWRSRRRASAGRAARRGEGP